jgi:DNA-binding IclR family transcriptional regulator
MLPGPIRAHLIFAVTKLLLRDCFHLIARIPALSNNPRDARTTPHITSFNLQHLGDGLVAPCMKEASAAKSETPKKGQTMLRGLDILEAIGNGARTVADIATVTGISFSTTHRLASSLAERGYLRFEPRKGYSLGQKLIELGFVDYREVDIRKIARPYMEELANRTHDTIHLAALAHDEVTYLDKIPGKRAVEISSRIGGRKPVCTTGVGKALILDRSEDFWLHCYDKDFATAPAPFEKADWIAKMRNYVGLGYTEDIGENDASIRCIAAPIRDGSNRIVAAISVSSAREYMDPQRMRSLIGEVKNVARAISAGLGAGNTG